MKIELPKIFTKGTWDGMGSKPEWEQHIGKPRLSYSQINTFTNTAFTKEPVQEYIRQNFLGQSLDIHEAYGPFGSAVEDYICFRNNEYGFDEEERSVLETIQPLGTFQTPILLDFKDFVLIGYKDDENTTVKRDYKTASNKSKEQYLNGKYKQLHIYALDDYMNHNKRIPDMLEVCIIERLGNPYREKLKVGKNVWWHEMPLIEEDLLFTKRYVEKTAAAISKYYKCFKKINV